MTKTKQFLLVALVTLPLATIYVILLALVLLCLTLPGRLARAVGTLVLNLGTLAQHGLERVAQMITLKLPDHARPNPDNGQQRD